MFPTVFVSHGSPMLMLHNTQARDFLTGFGTTLGRPKAILMCSAHYESTEPTLSADAKPEMIYDFGGFPQALFEMIYAAPGDPELAQRAAQLLSKGGLSATTQTHRGYDHGTWVPLKLMYPDADIPVVQLSVQTGKSAAHHAHMGRLLAPLRNEGVLIMGSGSLTHNLYELMRSRRVLESPVPEWVSVFGEWAHERTTAGALDDICNYLERAPYARENHPSAEHYLPLPFAMGAAGEGAKGTRVHTSHEYGVLMMDAYTFD